MKVALVIVVSLALVALVTSRAADVKVRYDNYKVYRVTPKDEAQFKILLELENQGVSFWDGPSGVGRSSDIALAPHQQTDLLEGLREAGMDVEIYVQDIQALIDQETVAPVRADGRLSWTAYHRLADIYAFLDEQAAQHDHVTVHTYGKSYEGRDLKVLKISKPGSTNRPVIFIESNIHAREWITNAVTTYIINELLNGSDDSITGLLDEFDFEIVTVTNPDGYEYTHTNDRMWRKTRSATGSPLGCKGADPNRNWDYEWFTGGSSSNPCLETYAGGSAFSEPETKLLADYFDTIASRVVFYFDLHSYSQYLLIPYGFTDIHIPQYNDFYNVGTAAASAIARRYGTRFVTGNIVDLLYVASGGSVDWVLGKHNIPLVFAAELRDTGANGFVLPANQIVPSALELLDGFKVFVDHVRAK